MALKMIDASKMENQRKILIYESVDPKYDRNNTTDQCYLHMCKKTVDALMKNEEGQNSFSVVGQCYKCTILRYEITQGQSTSHVIGIVGNEKNRTEAHTTFTEMIKEMERNKGKNKEVFDNSIKDATANPSQYIEKKMKKLMRYVFRSTSCSK